MVNPKHAFWQALLFSILIFSLGLLLGFFLENARVDTIQANALRSEINLLDQQLRTRVINDLSVRCSDVYVSTFEFADAIYNEALKLERYDAASKFMNTLKLIHTRYDLLRMMLWIDAVNLKRNCSAPFHTVIYLFDYDSQSIDIKSKQAALARMLTDLKNTYPDEVLLIPIAANLNITSVDLALKTYHIEHAPAIIIDEETVISDVVSFDDMRNMVFGSNK